MSKLQLNSALAGVRGTIDGWVYKHYRADKRGMVLSRKPDMSKVVPSPAQRKHRAKMKEAAAFHRRVLSDPVLLKKYQRIAKQRRINLSAATMGEVLRKK